MIDKKQILVAAAAFCFAVIPAFGQRPHPAGPGGAPGGASGSHGPAMSNGAAAHANTGGAAKGGTASSPTNVLNKNSKLDSTLTSNLQSKGLLPAGTDLKDACSGFKNLGQCVAAIHVSHNLNIPFACMQANMTGIAPAAGTTCPAGTGSSKLSLGKSIRALSPNADAKAESKTGESEANADLKQAETAS